ncbi:MAG: hypothetical protein C3F07_04340 [Anaerolineales bacterium]|nr:hypothetical protein [Anaerolineae bacterium]PWB76052.1 MAG: hypothetical protein C3F07_04340 [Anaerolineales bacterium]
MSIRPLALLDLPYLYGFRDEALGLDTSRTLTRGNPLGAVGLLSYVNPSRHIYSAIANGEEDSVLGGITHTPDETFAKLYYLAPASRLDHPYLPDLIENLSAQAGTWGAFHVLAEVDEANAAFVSLRKSGFSVYAWQRMWDVSGMVESDSGSGWMRVKSVHLPSIQSLYHQIVPPLLHPVEPQPKAAVGWMCNEGAKCYVNVSQGVYGIVLTPLIHPEATEVSDKLSALMDHLPDRRNRPVYVCVRSYQAWLEPVLADLGAKPGQRQAVMVKHLVHMVKDAALARTTQPAGVSVQPSRVNRVEVKNGSKN